MMKLTKLFVLGLLFVTTAAHAELPSGRYSGFVSNNSFNEWCNLNRATIDFRTASDGSANVFWEEQGYAPQGGGFCENHFDATFIPTGTPNEWTVNFAWDFNLSFGRAVLKDDILEISANYDSFRTGYQYFRTRLKIKPSNNSITYERRIERFGPTLFATGVLYK